MKKRLYLMMLIFISLSISLVSAIDFNNGLVSYYAFEGTTGPVDDLQSFNAGTNNGATRGVTGIVGNAFSYTTNDFVTFASNFSSQFGNDGTISIWLKFDSLSGATPFDLGNSSNAESWFNPGTTVYTDTLRDDRPPRTLTKNETGVWNMWTFTNTPGANGYKIFVNGQNFLNDTGESIINLDHAYGNSLGRSKDGGAAFLYFEGDIDELGMWNRTLNITEVQELYTRQLAGETFPFSGISITPLTPADDLTDLEGYFLFNASIVSDANPITNATLTLNGIDNETISLTGLTNHSAFNKSLSLGSYNWSITACESGGTCATTVNRTLTVRPHLENFIFYPRSTNPGNTELFWTTFNLSDGTTFSDGNFVLDNVSYSISATTTGNQVNLSKELTIPATIGNLTAYFNMTSNKDSENTTIVYTDVLSLAVDDCSVNTNVLYNFTMYDEQSLALLTPATYYTNGSLNVQLYNNDRSFLISNYSKSYTNTNPFAICLANALVNNTNYNLDLELQYDAKGYAKEFYNIKGETVTIDDLNTAIGLYDLINTSSQEFQILYKDSSFLPVAEAVIQIQRNYVGEGLFRTVEQPITDSNGKTVAHLEVDDVIYTFIILVNGEVEATFNDVIAYCPNPTFNDCEITLNQLSSNVIKTDYANVGPVAFTLDLNKTSRVVESIFSVKSGVSAYVTLNVSMMDTLGTSVCSTGVSASSGTLTCSIPSSFGNSTVIIDLYHNGVHVGQKVASLSEDPGSLYGENIVILGLIMVMTIVGLTMVGNPMIAIFGLILSSIVLIGLNIVQSNGLIGAGATILWFVIALVVIMIKGVNR